MTLTGTVESWEAYLAAVENAYEAGAELISARLDIGDGSGPNLVDTQPES